MCDAVLIRTISPATPPSLSPKDVVIPRRGGGEGGFAQTFISRHALIPPPSSSPSRPDQREPRVLSLLRCQGLGGAKAERQEGGRLWMAGLPPARRQAEQYVISEGVQMFNGAPLLLLVALIRMGRRGEERNFRCRSVGRGRGGSVGKDKNREGGGKTGGAVFSSPTLWGRRKWRTTRWELFCFFPAARDGTSRGCPRSSLESTTWALLTSPPRRIVSRIAWHHTISSRQGRCKRGPVTTWFAVGNMASIAPFRRRGGGPEGVDSSAVFFSLFGGLAWGGRLALARCCPIFLFSISHFPLCRVADA